MRYLVVISLIFEALLASLDTAFAASVTVHWDPSSDPDVIAYQLYYGAGTQAYQNVIAAGQETSVTVDGLAEGVTYDFAATSLKSDGSESVFSNEVVYQVPNSGGSDCIISISDLDPYYDGTPKPVSVSTAPYGLNYLVTYSGSPNPPTEAGYYLVRAVSIDNRCGNETTAILTIHPANASVQLGNLQQEYDGKAKAAVALTDPPGLAVGVTYDGSIDAPTNGGVYYVSATILDNNYTGNTTGTLVINQGQGMVYLAALNKDYDGTPPQIWTLTSPPGLALDVTYNGVPDPPTDAGIYQVTATINDPSVSGSSTVTMTIGKAELPIQLGNLGQVYDGTPKAASATTLGIGVGVDITYNGSPDPPIEPGTYSVEGTVNQNNFQGNATGILVLAKAHAMVTFADLRQTADGSPKSPSVTTDPPGLNVLLKYLGQPGAPSAPGTYAVSGIVNDPNYEGSGTASFGVAGSTAFASAAKDSAGSAPTGAGRPLILSWSGVPSGIKVWSSSNLNNWVGVTNFSASSGSFLVQPTGGSRFFKATSGDGTATARVPIVLK